MAPSSKGPARFSSGRPPPLLKTRVVVEIPLMSQARRIEYHLSNASRKSVIFASPKTEDSVLDATYSQFSRRFPSVASFESSVTSRHAYPAARKRRPNSPTPSVNTSEPSSSRSPSITLASRYKPKAFRPLSPSIASSTGPVQPPKKSISARPKYTFSHVEITNVHKFKYHPDWQQVRELYFRRKARKALRDKSKGKAKAVDQDFAESEEADEEAQVNRVLGLRGSLSRSVSATSSCASGDRESTDRSSGRRPRWKGSYARLISLEGDDEDPPYFGAQGDDDDDVYAPSESDSQRPVKHKRKRRGSSATTSTETEPSEILSDREYGGNRAPRYSTDEGDDDLVTPKASSSKTGRRQSHSERTPRAKDATPQPRPSDKKTSGKRHKVARRPTTPSTSEYEAPSESDASASLLSRISQDDQHDDGDDDDADCPPARYHTTAKPASKQRQPGDFKRAHTIYTSRKQQRPLREFTAEELDRLRDMDAEGWCHMCHKKKLVMRCHTHAERLKQGMKKGKRAGAGAVFCDPCLAKYPIPFDPFTTFSCPQCSGTCICSSCVAMNEPSSLISVGTGKRKRDAEEAYTKALSKAKLLDLEDIIDLSTPSPRNTPAAKIFKRKIKPRPTPRKPSVASTSSLSPPPPEESSLGLSMMTPPPEPSPEISSQESFASPPLTNLDLNLELDLDLDIDATESLHSDMSLGDPYSDHILPIPLPCIPHTPPSPETPSSIGTASYFDIIRQKALQEVPDAPKLRQVMSVDDYVAIAPDARKTPPPEHLRKARWKYGFLELDSQVIFPGQTWTGDVGMFAFKDSETPIAKPDFGPPLASPGEDGAEWIPQDFGVRLDQLELLPPLADTEGEEEPHPVEGAEGAAPPSDAKPDDGQDDAMDVDHEDVQPSVATSPMTAHSPVVPMQRETSDTTTASEELTPSTSTSTMVQDEEETAGQPEAKLGQDTIAKALQAVMANVPWLSASC